MALGLLLVLLLIAALIPLGAGGPPPRTVSMSADPAASPQDPDLDFYAELARRLRAGESYYDIIVPAQRQAGYPVTPAWAVRLPTLAYVEAWIGDVGQRLAALALLAAVLATWYLKLRRQLDDRGSIAIGLALLLVGSCLAFNRDYYPLHEFWAGLLMALSFGLHRSRERWVGSVIAGAAALALRELALPFVLLMAARALAQGQRREAAAWALTLLLFAIGMAFHFAAVAPHVLPNDPPSPSWLAARGPGGALGNVVLSSPLYLLPHWVAGPLVILALLGWLGWNSPTGTFGAQLHTGYLLAFAVVGRSDNFYWGMLITPTLFVGLAFAGDAIASLAKAALRASGGANEGGGRGGTADAN